MKNDLTAEQLKQPVTVTLPLGVVLDVVQKEIIRAELAISDAIALGFAGLPAIGVEWQGGVYAGLSLEDERPVALILLPGEPEEANWKDALAWAEKQNGALPSRIDQLMLFKNLKREFKEAWYWSCEQYAGGDASAWCQLFYNGRQYSYYKYYELRARAVRRLPIQ